MKALVFEEPRRATVSELDVPAIAADEVLVRSRNVGICHSDFELYEGRYIIPVSYPIIPGHEWSGEIAEVAVLGGGPIGLLCTLAAATMGGSVTLIEPQAHRRTLGLEIGARQAIDPTDGSLFEQVAELTRGRGFDVVIEAAGVPAAMA